MVLRGRNILPRPCDVSMSDVREQGDQHTLARSPLSIVVIVNVAVVFAKKTHVGKKTLSSFNNPPNDHTLGSNQYIYPGNYIVVFNAFGVVVVVDGDGR